MLLVDLLRRPARCTSGQATLEAAIALPVAILLMIGGLEFANLFLSYGTAAKSVRDAARYLAHVQQATLCGSGLSDAILLAKHGSLTSTALQLIPEATIFSTPDTNCGNPSNITLQAVVPYTPLMFSGIPYTSIRFFPRNLTVTHQEPWIGE